MTAKRMAGFRSKNEFAWALAFDAASLKYIYERKTFQLSNGEYYLPDFYFPETGCWAEIKTKADKHEIEKARLLSEELDVKEVVLLEKYPSYRRDYKSFINGQMFMAKFIVFEGQIFDPRGLDSSLKKDMEDSIISFQDKRIGEQVSCAKHFSTNEFTAEYVKSEMPSWSKTINHLKNQGWHDYLESNTDVHS